MTEEIRLPRLGDMTESVVIVSWYVTAGEAVAEGDPIARVETDKVETDVMAPSSGTITEIHAEAGDEVSVGELIALIEVS